MAKGSQLSQLKSALSQAGITGQNGSSGKKRKRGSQSEAQDRDKKAAKLDAIQQRMNPFDLKVTKLKHDVGGRKIKGVVGKPAKSKQAGLDQRNKTLLKEYSEKDRAGGILDRRFGENDPSMNPEERMLERFTRERQRASKGVVYNLEDEEDLTHYGQSLAKLDDFDNVGLGLDDDEDEDPGRIDRDVVRKTHFGGFGDEEGDDDEDDEGSARKKSKAEVMAEVMAKSKEHKMRRQMERLQDDDMRHQLDAEFDSLRALLYAPDPSSSGSNAVPLGRNARAETLTAEDDDYDKHVKELVFDRKARPKDRTKTEEELAVLAKMALEKEERKRLRRMRGEEDEDSEDDTKHPRKTKRRREPSGDDLEDDLVLDDMEQLGAGLEDVEQAPSSDDSDEEYDEQDGSAGSEGSSEEDSEVSEDEDEAEAEAGDVEQLISSKKSSARTKTKSSELPFTFDCPANHAEFLEIIDDVKADDVPVVVQRIRTLYHPSLGPDNHQKLQGLTVSLIDHILYISSPPTPRFGRFPALLPQVIALCKAYPVQSAQHVVDKLALMHKNLKRGLSLGALDDAAKTWPGIPELTLFRLIGALWPTSDMNHAVITPARLLMGAYLGLGRIRGIRDLASGLFLCTLFCQYEQLSKRLVPEAINFLVNAILHLCPHRYQKAAELPGLFPAPDFKVPELQAHGTKSLTPGRPNITDIITNEETSDQTKLDLLSLSLELVGRFADLYKSLDGFIELYEPILAILSALTVNKVSKALKITTLIDQITKLIKFSRQARKPLALQAHKPIPIPTFIPKFETATSNYLRRQDPDHEKNAASKLRYQYKQERKGAIRELRKDNRFLAGVQQKEQKEKDRAYKDGMNKVFASMQGERAEQKALDREKAKEERRSGKK